MILAIFVNKYTFIRLAIVCVTYCGWVLVPSRGIVLLVRGALEAKKIGRLDRISWRELVGVYL